MSTFVRSSFFAVSLALVAACGDGTTPFDRSSPGGGTSGGATGGAPTGGGTGPYAAELQQCVDRTNEYRASIGKPAYARSAALESFAAKAADSDSKSNQPHGYFSQTSGGGVASAENAIPGWPMKQFGSVAKVVDNGIEMMWNEGPGGGHHDAIASSQYKEMGCGIAVTGDGDVWVVQDFH